MVTAHQRSQKQGNGPDSGANSTTMTGNGVHSSPWSADELMAQKDRSACLSVRSGTAPRLWVQWAGRPSG